MKVRRFSVYSFQFLEKILRDIWENNEIMEFYSDIYFYYFKNLDILLRVILKTEANLFNSACKDLN